MDGHLRIDELTISAYGTLAKRRWSLPTDLTILFGPNEAGKTTLKSFIETILYGFEPASDRHPYLPWDPAGQSFGGEIAYVLQDGQGFRLRRFLDLSGRRAKDESVLLAGTEPGSPKAGIDPADVATRHLRQPRAIFRTVFSLSLEDLIGLERIPEDDQRHIERVFFREMAGLGLVANPRQVLEALHENLERTKRYGGSRKKAEITEFEKNELARAAADLKLAQEDQRRARSIQSEIDELESLQQAKRGQRRQLEQQLQTEARRGQLVELFCRWQQLEQQLADFKDVQEFDESLAAELNGCLERRGLRADDLTRISDEAERARARVAELRQIVESGGPLLAHAETIEQLSRLTDSVGQVQSELASQEAQLEARKQELCQQFSTVSPKASVDRSRAASVSTTVCDELLAKLDVWGRSHADLVGLKSRLAAQQQQLDQASRDAERLKMDLPEDMPPDFSTTRLRELEEVHRLIAALNSAERDLDAERHRLRDEDEDLNKARKHVAETSGAARAAVPVTWVVTGFVATIFGAMATTYQLASSYNPLGALPYMVIMVAGVALLVHLRQRRQKTLQADDLVRQSPLLQHHLMRAESARARVEQRQKDLDERTQELRQRWQQARLDGHPDARRLGEQIAQLRAFDESRADHARWRTLITQREDLAQQVEQSAGQVRQLQDELAKQRDAIRERFHALDLIWADQDDPASARDRVVRAGELAARWTDLQREEEAMRTKREQQQSFDQRVGELLAELGEPSDDPNDRVRKIEQLKGRLDWIRQQDAKAIEAEQYLTKLRTQQDELQEGLNRLNEQISQCCQRLNIDGYESLKGARQRAQEHRELARQEAFLAEELTRQRRAAGVADDWSPDASEPGEPAEGTTAEIGASDDDRAATGAKRTELEAELEHAASQIESLKHELNQINSRMSTEVAEGALEAAYDRLAEMNERFDVLLVAHRVLDSALDEFQRKRQPQIIRKAQSYMSALTGGQYERLQADLLGERKKLSTFEVVPDDGQGRVATSFSRGTQEQMYLALRLALADQLSAAESLPLILDDVLVNCDDRRLEGAADLIARISKSRQILFLTCHEQTREVLISRGGTVINL